MLRRHPIEERKNGSLGCYNQGDFGISINEVYTRRRRDLSARMCVRLWGHREQAPCLRLSHGLAQDEAPAVARAARARD